MTPAPTAPERKYIITEEDLMVISDYFLAALNGDSSKTKLRQLMDSEYSCIRSRPAPTAPEIHSMYQDEDGHISWQRMNEQALEEHDAHIRTEDREKVLDDLEIFIKQKWSSSIPRERRWILEKIESLRTPKEQP
jgi:hypothetical protein